MHILLTVMIMIYSYGAFASEVRCPEIIETTQAIAKSIDGWSERIDNNSQHRLNNFQIYSGHPKENASLVPEQKKETFSWTNDRTYPLWISCQYDNTSLRLEMKLPETAKKCSTRLQKNKYTVLNCN